MPHIHPGNHAPETQAGILEETPESAFPMNHYPAHVLHLLCVACIFAVTL